MRKYLGLLFLYLIISACNPLTPLKSQSGEQESIINPPEENTAPDISAVAPQSVQANSTANSFSFQISDEEDLLNCNSSVLVTSDDMSLIEGLDFTLSGSAPNCLATFSPKMNQYGSATLTLQVTDGEAFDSVDVTLEVLFNPTVFANLTAWHDGADDSTWFQDSNCLTPTINGGDPVGCWMDKSGNDFHATMNVASQIPSLNLGLNQGSIEFDGTNDFYDDNHSYTARTVYIIYRMDSVLQQTSDLAQLWGLYSVGHVAPDPRNTGLWSFDGNAGQSAFYGVNGNALSGPTTGSNAQAWVYNNFEMVRTVFTNDLNITRQVLGSLVPNFGIGVHQFGGQIAEIVVFSSTQGAAETEIIEGYLACKWGLQGDLPMAHPFKSNCP